MRWRARGVARLMHETSLPPKLRAVLLRLLLHGGTAIGTMAELASLLGVHRTRLARVIEAIELSGCVRVEQVQPSGRSRRLRLEIVDEEATQTVSPEPPGGASSAMPEAARSSEDPPAPEPEPEDNPVGLVGESQAEMEALLDQVRDRELLERVMHCAEGSLPLGERLGIRRRVKDWIRPVIEQQEREDATQENLELAINKALLQTLRQIDSPPKRSDGSLKWKNWLPKVVGGHLELYERPWEQRRCRSGVQAGGVVVTSSSTSLKPAGGSDSVWSFPSVSSFAFTRVQHRGSALRRVLLRMGSNNQGTPIAVLVQRRHGAKEILEDLLPSTIGELYPAIDQRAVPRSDCLERRRAGGGNLPQGVTTSTRRQSSRWSDRASFNQPGGWDQSTSTCRSPQASCTSL